MQTEQEYTAGDRVQVRYKDYTHQMRGIPKRAQGNFFTVLQVNGCYLLLAGPRGGQVVATVKDVIPIATQG